MKNEGLNNKARLLILIIFLTGYFLKAQVDSVFAKCYSYDGEALTSMVIEFSEIIRNEYGCSSSHVLSLSGSDNADTFYLRQFPALYMLDDNEFGVASMLKVDSFFVIFDPRSIPSIGEEEVSVDFTLEQIPSWALNKEYQCDSHKVSYLEYLNTWASFLLAGVKVELMEVHYPQR